MHWSKNPEMRKKVLEKISKKLKGRVSPRKGVKLSQTVKEKMSKSQKGNTNKKGYKLTEKQKENCRKAFKKSYKKENHYNYGKKLSKETCQKKSKAIKSAYKEGRMEYMQKVWEDNGKKWLGKKNPRWSKEAKHFSGRGYVFVKDNEGNRRVEHRVVVEKIIGRKLKRTETIHHLNEDKSDNRIENLYYYPNDNLHKRYHGLKDKPKLISNIKKGL